jgi:hypothetical protein
MQVEILPSIPGICRHTAKISKLQLLEEILLMI